MNIKKIISVALSLCIASSCLTLTAYAKENTTLAINKSDISHEVSPMLFGVSLEDVSYSCDGGLVSNLVNNNSFEFATNPEYAWSFDGVSTVVSKENPICAANPSYELIKVDGKGTVENNGFTEIYKNNSYKYSKKSAETADMGFKSGVTYNFSCYVKNVDYDGKISIYLDSKSNKDNIVQVPTTTVGKNEWTKISAQIKSSSDEDGALAILFEGNGSLQLDCVSLCAVDSYGAGDGHWKYVTLRNDMVDAIKNLKPSFIRFPGSAGIGGGSVDSMMTWKDTIGDISQRRQSSSIYSSDENPYNNSNSMGYHEYFQLCEDLAAAAVPVVSAGITYQGEQDKELIADAYNKINMTDEQFTNYLVNERGFDEKDSDAIAKRTESVNKLNIKSIDDFNKYIDTVALKPGTDAFDNYVQDVLDLIEYANGDAQGTYWGALRAANGHDEPFNMEYIEIGSGDEGSIYQRNYEALYNAIKKVYPDINIITSAGEKADSEAVNTAITKSGSSFKAVVDEHYSADVDCLLQNTKRYDSYDREGAEIMVGEYSAVDDATSNVASANNIETAVAHAAFMTGFERNSDVVKMTSYVPAFAKINANSHENNLVWFDSQSLYYTPEYYNQLLFSNNTGKEYVNTSLNEDGIYQSVTVDHDKQVLYVKLVNSTNSTKKMSVNLDGFGKINKVSNESLAHDYKSAYNELGKQRVAPQEKAIDSDDSSFDIKLEKNSVNVIRIAYGSNNGDALYTFPESLDLSVKKYVPTAAKVFIIVICLSIPVGGVAGFYLYTKVISKSGGKGHGKKKNKKKKRK